MSTQPVSAPGSFLGKIKPLELVLGLLLLEVAAALIVTGLRIVILGNSSSLVDDAYIPLRFADNAARGFGWVWNRGGVPVYGFTSLLYAFILVAIEWAGGSPLVAVPLIGVSGAVICIGLAFLLLRRLNPGRDSDNLAGAILLGLSPQLWFWSKAGLETTLFAALLLASTSAYIGLLRGEFPEWGAGLLFGLAALIRPEGTFFLAATAAFDALVARRRANRRYLGTALLLAGFLAVFIPVFVWSWSYFGQALPNTYYAKTGAVWLQIRGGWSYLGASMPAVLKQSSLPILAFAVFLRKPRLPVVYLLCLVSVGLIMIVLEGGDHLPFARFVVPLLPLMFVLGALGLSELTGRLGRASGALLLAAFLVAALIGLDPRDSLTVLPKGLQLPRADSSRFQYMNDPLPGFIAMGRALREDARPGQAIATVPIGAIGYFSELPVIDMVGLTDPYIAHEPFDLKYAASWYPGHDKGDGLYILRQRPDYIQLVDLLTSQPLPGVDEVGRQFKSVMEIWAAPEFHALYEFAPLRVEGGWYYNLYRLRTDG